MNAKKKLSLKKIDVSKLNTITGGFGAQRGYNTGNPDGCGMNTNFTACQYTQDPMSRIACVDGENGAN